MTALLEKAWQQVSRLPDTEQDEVAAILLKTLEQKESLMQPGEDRQPGSAKGLIWMSPDFEEPRPYFGSAKGLGRMMPDFEEPLEDFKDYM